MRRSRKANMPPSVHTAFISAPDAPAHQYTCTHTAFCAHSQCSVCLPVKSFKISAASGCTSALLSYVPRGPQILSYNSQSNISRLIPSPQSGERMCDGSSKHNLLIGSNVLSIFLLSHNKNAQKLHRLKKWKTPAWKCIHEPSIFLFDLQTCDQSCPIVSYATWLDWWMFTWCPLSDFVKKMTQKNNSFEGGKCIILATLKATCQLHAPQVFSRHLTNSCAM